jgi:hypothetical protein
VFVGAVVVAHQMQRDPGVDLGDLFEKPQELLVSMPRVAGVDDFPGGDFQRGEQGGGAMPVVVIGLALGETWSH